VADCETCGQEEEGPTCELCAYDARMDERAQLLREVELEAGLEEGEAEWPWDGGW
jgi:recombinational DNA repair protein RecR